MGLAAPKNKRKLGNDPNNTRWSRNTENFGHRMLRSQGWEPGQYLGPQDASHAVYHTLASASHIKVALKEDNLGLGAKMNRGDECTGLNAFKEMLARLNGKSESVIEQEKKAREAHAMNVYVERKFGTMRFISGGFLVGDAIHENKQANVENSVATPEPAEALSEKEKKRKVGQDDDQESQCKEERRRAKKQKKSRKETVSGRDDEEHNGENNASEEDSAKPRSEKPHKSKKEKKRRRGEPPADEQGSEGEESREKRRKREKKERKERRREKREKKLKKKLLCEENGSSSGVNSDNDSTAVESGASTPAANDALTPVSQVSARHLARRRFIAQKRMALKDQQALNQIFMIKSS